MSTNKILPIGLTVLSLSAVCGSAMANVYPQEREDDLKSVCRNAAEDDRMGLRRAVKDLTPSSKIHTTTYKVLANQLVCNGMELVAFAKHYGATDTYKLLKHYSNPATRIEIQDMTISRSVPDDITVSLTTGN